MIHRCTAEGYLLRRFARRLLRAARTLTPPDRERCTVHTPSLVVEESPTAVWTDRIGGATPVALQVALYSEYQFAELLIGEHCLAGDRTD
jgi:hypothetical protein